MVYVILKQNKDVRTKDSQEAAAMGSSGSRPLWNLPQTGLPGPRGESVTGNKWHLSGGTWRERGSERIAGN